MRKIKVILSNMLTFLMVIGLLQNTVFVREVKADSKEAKYLIKENAIIYDSIFYDDKIFIAYSEDNEKIKISLIENGEEEVLYKDIDEVDIMFQKSNVDKNILLVRLFDYSGGTIKLNYIKINIEEKKACEISEEEFNSLYEDTFIEVERKEWTDSEIEDILQKINESSELNLTIADKKLEPVDEYYSEYVNEDKSERIAIQLNYFENNTNIIEFSLKYSNENMNKEVFYFGVVYGDYAYLGTENALYSPEYKIDGENLFIIEKDEYSFITKVTKVNKDGLLSTKIINNAYKHQYYEVHEDVLYIYKGIGETSFQLPKLDIYMENQYGYELVREVEFLAKRDVLEDNSKLLLIKNNNKFEVIKIKGIDSEFVADITEVIPEGTIGGKGYFNGMNGNLVFFLDNSPLIIRQEINSNKNEEEVLPPSEENRPNENTTLDIEIPDLNANEVNEIPVVSDKTNKFNIILKDIEALKSGQGSLKLVLNNTTLKLPFSVLDSNLLGKNDTVSVKMDVLSDLEITKDLKAVNKVFDFNLIVNKENEEIKIHNFKEGVAEITIALTDEDIEGLNRDKLKVYYYNEETKKFEAMETKVEGNNVTFKTSHFSKYIISEEIVDNNVDKPNTDNNGEEANKPNVDNSTTTSEKNEEVTIKPDTDNTNNSTINSSTKNNEEITTEAGKGNLPSTGSVVSNNMILVISIGIVLLGVNLFFRRKKVF